MKRHLSGNSFQTKKIRMEEKHERSNILNKINESIMVSFIQTCLSGGFFDILDNTFEHFVDNNNNIKNELVDWMNNTNNEEIFKSAKKIACRDLHNSFAEIDSKGFSFESCKERMKLATKKIVEDNYISCVRNWILSKYENYGEIEITYEKFIIENNDTDIFYRHFYAELDGKALFELTRF